jgi:hypothetical protein
MIDLARLAALAGQAVHVNPEAGVFLSTTRRLPKEFRAAACS